MQKLMKAIVTFFVLLSVTACQPGTRASANDEVELNEVEVEIVSVKPEKDGSTVTVRDNAGNMYQAVISIPNLGPDSNFDFDHLEPGNRMIVSGESWFLGAERQLTVREANAI